MRMEIDIDAAASRGIISEDQAIALRNFEAETAGEPLASSERFQLFGGLSDIMAALGLAMTLLALGLFLSRAHLTLLFLAFPPVLFVLARRIDLKRKPCLTMVIFVAIVATLASALPVSLDVWGDRMVHNVVKATAMFVLGIAPALVAMVMFWRRFRFPPVPAVAAGLTAVSVSLAFRPNLFDGMGYGPANAALLFMSIGILGWAIWWDLTDIRRETDRSQIAFWLHCCSGFLITRSACGLFTGNDALNLNLNLGLGSDQVGPFLVIFALCALISLILDRRSLLASSVLPMLTLFMRIGAAQLGLFAMGCFLLLFAFVWNAARVAVLRLLPTAVVAQLPRTQIVQPGQRPTRRHRELMPRKFR